MQSANSAQQFRKDNSAAIPSVPVDEMKLDTPRENEKVDEKPASVASTSIAKSPSISPSPVKPPMVSATTLPSETPQVGAASGTRPDRSQSSRTLAPPQLNRQRLSPSPMSLPVNPITGLTPNIPKSPNLLPARPASTGFTNVTPGSSPIISHFPKSPKGASLQTITNGKRKSLHVESAAPVNAASVKRQKSNDGSAYASTGTGSEEDGLAEDEEEGEEGEYLDLAAGGARSVPDAKTLESKSTRNTERTAGASIIGKSGLPSFTKKGRMSDLMDRDRSRHPRSQSASRANTPVSHGADSDSNTSGSPYRSSISASLRIVDDKDFLRHSTDFKTRLFPAYSKLYSRLERVKESLRDGRDVGTSGYTAGSIAGMVDEVNARSKELERIKHALWSYNEEQQRSRPA